MSDPIGPALHTVLSPSLLHAYNPENTVVVVIDVLRATSTIATALYNGVKYIYPVDSVVKCIEIGKSTGAVTAGEREGKVAEGLEHGNSPLEYTRNFIEGKTMVLTTTNGTKLLQMAVEAKAHTIVTGSFVNLSAVEAFLLQSKKDVLLACGGWKDRVNIEDTLFAGALVHNLAHHFNINCDASHLAKLLYENAASDLYGYLERNKAVHFERLSGYGLKQDIAYCLSKDVANVLPIYKEGKIVIE